MERVQRDVPERNNNGFILMSVKYRGLGKNITQLRDLAGRLGWLAALDGKLVPETEADAYIARQVDRDPDLWVVEIEDRKGRNWFEGDEI